MNSIKQNYAFVLKSIKKDRSLKPIVDNLKGKTFIVSGASRGIGFNIAKKLAIQGANVTIVGKTVRKHPKLEGTIYSAAEEICDVVQNSSCIGIPCDIRVSKELDNVINETLDVCKNRVVKGWWQ